VPIASREQTPVDPPNVISRHVRPVFGKIRRCAEQRRAVQPIDEAFNHRARQQLQVPDPCQHGRVEVRSRLQGGSGHAVLVAGGWWLVLVAGCWLLVASN